jgi:hypothetical protein
LLEVLICLGLGSLLLMAIGHLLVSGKTLSRQIGQRADQQERIGLVTHILSVALKGAGHLGCLTEQEYTTNLLNSGREDLGALWPAPAVEIVADPQSSPDFSDIDNLAEGSQALIVRGYARPLARLNQPLGENRGEGWLHDMNSRIDSGDVVLISDCRQGALFSATGTWHSQGRVRFSWAVGGGDLDNASVGETFDGMPVLGGLSQIGEGFAGDAGLWGNTGLRLYVAESRTNTGSLQTYGLWQKPARGNALELVTGIDGLRFRYGAWRGGRGGHMGYFDPDRLPSDARVVLLSARFFLSTVQQGSSGGITWRRVEIAVPLNASAPP